MATYSIAANGDDGTKVGAGFDATSTIGYIGYASGNYELWFRFAGIAAAQGSTCASAYITFKGADAGSGTGMLTAFYGVDEDNHAAPTTGAEWTTDHGVHTTAKVDFDFSGSFNAGDTITSHTVVDVTGGITIGSSDVAAGAVRVWVSGGTIGTPASLTVRIVTAGGRTKDQTLYFKVKKH